MPTLFDQAVEIARRLPEEEREAIAQIMLDEIEDEEVWQRKFSATAPQLDQLAEQALEADKDGKTTPLKFPHS